MHIAIIGSGVSGLVCAHHLRERHRLSIFEADDRVGGHANTVRVDLADETHHVDTGFIVYNDRNYPVFSRLLGDLGVDTQPSEMSLAVTDERAGLEWGTAANRMFAQRRNLARPGFLADDRARSCAGTGSAAGCWPPRMPIHSVSLARLPRRAPLLPPLPRLVPRTDGAAIWSADPTTVDRFPAVTVCRFLHNHGMLSFGDRPSLADDHGGSRTYVAALASPMADHIHLGAAVEKVVRHADGIEVRARGREPEVFDRVVMALHSDQALEVLADADEVERSVIGAIRYQPNAATLHTDASMLPSRPKALGQLERARTPRTGESSHDDVPHEPAAAPRQPPRAVRHAQPRRCHRSGQGARPVRLRPPDLRRPGGRGAGPTDEFQGRGGIYWCGAYWGYGFHEDGARSGLDVATAIKAGR